MTRLWRKSNQSLSAPGIPPWKKFREGPRPRFWRYRLISGEDHAIPRLRRQSHGKLKGIPSAPGKRICAGLRGGARRTQTDNQPVMSLKAIRSTAAVVLFGPTIVRQDCGPIDRASPVQALSPWLIRTGPVNDRGPCTWRDEREGLKEANAPFHLPKNSPECTSRSCGPTDPWLRAEDGVLTNNVDQRGSMRPCRVQRPFRLGPDPSLCVAVGHD